MRRHFATNADISKWPDIFERAIVWARRHGGGTVVVPDMGFVKWCVLGGQDDALTSVDARLSEGVGVGLTTMGRLKDMAGPAVIVLAADGTEGERVGRYASKAGVAIEHLAVVARVEAERIAWSQAEGVTALDRDHEWALRKTGF